MSKPGSKPKPITNKFNGQNNSSTKDAQYDNQPQADHVAKVECWHVSAKGLMCIACEFLFSGRQNVSFTQFLMSFMLM